MDIRKLQRAIVDGLEDVKAQNVVVFNTEALSPLFERVIIASGTSNRQTKALASSVRETVRARGMQVLRTEGEDNGEWIIVDCGAAVAHIMQPTIREYYHLEEIWGTKPVRMKIGSVQAGLPKAAEPAQAGAQRVAAGPAAKTAGAKTPKAAARKRPPAGPAPAKKAGGGAQGARKTGSVKAPAVRAKGARTPAAKTPAARPAAGRARKAAAAAQPAAPRKTARRG